jgi:hypothetical protein
MRVFWIILALLTLAAGGWIVAARTSHRAAMSEVAKAQQARDAAIAAAATATPAPKPAPKPVEPAISESPAPALATPKPDPAPAPATPKPEPISGTIASDPASAQDGVVRLILTGTDGKPLSTRLGFKMAADLVVSPAHLVDQAISGTVTTSAGQTVPIIGTVVLDQGRDIAIFRLAQAIPATTALKFSTAETPADTMAFALPVRGSPVVPASILGYRTDTVQGRRVQIKAALPSNPVGMPIVGDKGELIGIVTGKDPSGAALVASAAEIAGLPRGKVTPLTTTAAAVKTADAGTAASAPTPAKGATGEAKVETASDAVIERKPDGTMLVDGKYTVKGEGSKEKPYEVTWEMLLSAQEVYDPRKGQKKLPGRVTMLDGKWVTITGYVAFPLYVDEPKELLSMLNQWDGCCIGVPPTPYDAIEVRLASAVSKDNRLATFGSVTGKLSIKPYLVGDWLVGLYLMDDASLTVKRFGGFGS